MLKILFKPNKTLVITRDMRIYQNENLANKLVIYIPKEWSDYQLVNFNIIMKWLNSGNKAYAEALTIEEESDREGYLLCTLPLDTKFTQFAGNNIIKLTMTWFNEEDGRTYTIESSELQIPILAQNDYFAYTADSAFASIDNKIAALQAETDKLAAITADIPTSVPTDLELNDQKLQLVNSEGGLMGDGVQISTAIDEQDGVSDAIVDLSDVSEDGSTSDTSAKAVDLKLTDDLLQLLTETGKTMGNGVKILVVPDEGDSDSDGIHDLSGSETPDTPVPSGNPEGDNFEDGIIDLNDI